VGVGVRRGRWRGRGRESRSRLTKGGDLKMKGNESKRNGMKRGESEVK
jgi:hypothetical protein